MPCLRKCFLRCLLFLDGTLTKPIFSNKMLKLYKDIDGTLQYWETWDKDEKTGIIHWGVVGDKGQDEEIKSSLLTNFRKKIQKLVDEKKSLLGLDTKSLELRMQERGPTI